MPSAAVIDQLVSRAGSPTFDTWWAQVGNCGFCAQPVHLARSSSDGVVQVMARCKNRRASVCPSCSDLYAGDTWHLVQAGISGSHGTGPDFGIQPMLFLTLTAPSFGTVHTIHHKRPDSRCTKGTGSARCSHGTPTTCRFVHEPGDPMVGQPLCAGCYDYTSHVLFTWHAPALWSRFVINARRELARHLRSHEVGLGDVTLSYVKVVEMQLRLAPHYHAVVRLDLPPTTSQPTVTSGDLEVLLRRAAANTAMQAPGPDGDMIAVRFGHQLDMQHLSAASTSNLDAGENARRVSAYIAKYVTKSLSGPALASRRISPVAIDHLDVSDHARAILHTLTALSQQAPYQAMAGWLHTLGYRGHITSKTRRYSTTLTALREQRAQWHNAQQPQQSSRADVPDQDGEDIGWECVGHGHRDYGERFLVISAALRAREANRVARENTNDSSPSCAGKR